MQDEVETDTRRDMSRVFELSPQTKQRSMENIDRVLGSVDERLADELLCHGLGVRVGLRRAHAFDHLYNVYRRTIGVLPPG